jgi:D-2-hydroxyacid dehydrogenase (NADP+)
MVNVVIYEQHRGEEWRLALQAKFPEVAFHAPPDANELAALVGDMDILLAFGLPDELLRRASKLQWIQGLGTGVDYITNLPSLRNEILVTSMRGIHGPQMSEMAFLQMLSLNRDFPQMVRNQDLGKWEPWPATLLWQKKVGILGLGVIGEELARKCKAFGMSVYGIDIVDKGLDCVDHFSGPEDTARVAAEVDYLIIVAPNTPQTANIVNEKVLSAMKPTAFLINIARGELVDEAALLDALQAGKIAGAALDAFVQEPLPADHPFWNLRNVIVTSHVGGRSDVYIEQTLPIIEENLRRYLKGERKDLVNVVSR